MTGPTSINPDARRQATPLEAWDRSQKGRRYRELQKRIARREPLSVSQRARYVSLKRERAELEEEMRERVIAEERAEQMRVLKAVASGSETIH